MNKRALIFGITGQDGYYLSRQLLAKGYEVWGLVRRQPVEILPCSYHIGDITSYVSVMEILQDSNPDEVYNLAAQTHVGQSYDDPDLTLRITGLGAANIFRAIWEYQQKTGKDIRVYQAGSSEEFGITTAPMQNELTPLNPVSPYACAKVLAHNMAHMYRQMGMKVWCGLLFNHESPKRPTRFVTTKIARAAALHQTLKLGNLDAVRDWGYAPEYTEGMWQMLQSDIPDDYVLATGESHSVREFLEVAYMSQGLLWEAYVSLNTNLKRPLDAGPLCGDASKAYCKLGWIPKTKFDQLVKILVNSFVEEGDGSSLGK